PSHKCRPGARPGRLLCHQSDGLPLGHVFHGHGVDAVTQPGRGRTVGKDVTQVTIAAGTAHLGTHHSEGAVLVLLESVLRDRSGERRPTGAGLELLARAEEGISTCRADVPTRLAGPEKTTLPGRFRAVLS